MFDIGVTELLVIAVVAIVVVGPKELPGMLRTIGQFVSKAKGMAREFQTQFEEAAEEAGVNELRDEMTQIGDITDDIDFDDALDPIKDLGEDLTKSVEIPDDNKPKAKTTKKSAAKPKKTAKKSTAKKPAKPKPAAKLANKGRGA